MRRSLSVAVTLCMGLFALAQNANAGPILGGSSLLTQSEVALLEMWLGEGALQLTNIFDHDISDGKTSNDFHAAADGRGRTFTVLQMMNQFGQYELVGGYNPLSWNSSTGYNMAFPDSERTAFLFNLTDTTLFRQRLSTSPYGGGVGQYQTYNTSGYGPTFGGGHDLWVSHALNYGYAYAYSYGAGTTNVLGEAYRYPVTLGAMEVFTIAPAPVAAVPEVGSLLLVSSALVGFVTRSRRKASASRPLGEDAAKRND